MNWRQIGLAQLLPGLVSDFENKMGQKLLLLGLRTRSRCGVYMYNAPPNLVAAL